MILKVFAILLAVLIASTLTETYSREKLKEDYPDLGKLFQLTDENRQPKHVNFDDRNVIEDVKESIAYIDENNMEKYVKLEYFSRRGQFYRSKFRNLVGMQYPKGIPLTAIEDLSIYVDNSKPTKFVTHGWWSDSKTNMCVLIRDGFLHRYDANVLVVDWGKISKDIIYGVPKNLTLPVGKHYGKYLNYLVDKVGVDPQDIHLVGHSLGAHVSGFAGREVKNGKVGRITGLDPALPGFKNDFNEKLNKNDASFVDVIHTCGGLFGYKLPLGHADFYPNGGGPFQPGCGSILYELLHFCSHNRAWKIFASSLVSEKPQMVTQCSTFADIEEANSCDGHQVPIGDLTPLTARGIFYSVLLAENLVYS